MAQRSPRKQAASKKPVSPQRPSAKKAPRSAPPAPKAKSPAAREPAAAKAPPVKATPVKAPPVKAPPVEATPVEVPRAPAPTLPPPAAETAAPPPQLPAGEAVQEQRTLPFELDPRRLEEGLKSLQGELVHWANKGRYTRVRFKFRGKQLLPDLPLAAVVAAEGLTFYWGGILRALLFNVAGKSVLSVELVNDADKRVQVGRECLLCGEVEEAQAHFREALAMDRDHAAAHLNLGVTYKLQGRRELAAAALEKARQKDPEGAVGAEAERLLKGLRPAPSQGG